MKRTVVAAMLAVSSLLAFPQAASANPCGLNCIYVTVIDGNGNVTGGYWECETQMICVE